MPLATSSRFCWVKRGTATACSRSWHSQAASREQRVLPVAVALGFRNEELIALLIMLGSPTTPSSYVMAKNMGHEGVLTSSCIATTTLLSALTLTGWIFLLRSGGYL